mmetsp:Transcript_16961/g.43281  ORF Transcript_16961/g.43281 Transcript_16961/m.43281 type:complete len:267 (-) Transcript_16961:935-1735(-)
MVERQEPSSCAKRCDYGSCHQHGRLVHHLLRQCRRAKLDRPREWPVSVPPTEDAAPQAPHLRSFDRFVTRPQQPPAPRSAPRKGGGDLAVDDYGHPLQHLWYQVLTSLHKDIDHAVVDHVWKRGTVGALDVPGSEIPNIAHVHEDRLAFLVQALGLLQADPPDVFDAAAEAVGDPHGAELVELLALELGNLLLDLRYGRLPPPLEELILLILLEVEVLLVVGVQLPEDPQQSPHLPLVHEGLEGAVHLPECIRGLRVAVLIRVDCQ